MRRRIIIPVIPVMPFGSPVHPELSLEAVITEAASSWANSSFIYKIPVQLIGAKAALKAIVWGVIYCKGCFALCLISVKKGVLRTCPLY